MKVLLLCALAAVALSQPISYSDDDETEWELFKVEHEKVYGDEKEENERKTIFLNNLKFIREHNTKFDRGEVTFNVAVNKFADLTNSEFKTKMNGFKIPENYKRKGEPFQLNDTLPLPSYVDWRKKGAVTGVKNQGMCGSCWAFSATGSLEGLTYIKKKKLISLSEQNLVDCSSSEGNEGCNGGLMDQAFIYVLINNGIDTEKAYPYEGQDDTCRYNVRNKGATDSGYVDVTSESETALQTAVAQVGPISVAIDAGHTSFQLYKSGVYKEPACSTEDLDHGVLAVGYGTARTGGDFWLVKNSWGTDWGMKGYILMARNYNNMCGIATMASYPKV